MSAVTNNSPTVDIRYALRRGVFSLNVDLDIPMRGITGIFGESGSGKTTLLRCIAGLETRVTGKLVIGGDVWQDHARNVSRPVHQQEIGYVFQEPRLFLHLSVRRNLEYGQQRATANHALIAFDQTVELFDLGPLLDRSPTELSGSEAQRVAIDRALLRSPRLLLMDEPLAALDSARKNEILPFLDRLHNELQIPIIYVSHHIEEICRLCDHLLVMERGRVIAEGDLQSVLVRLDLPLLSGEEAGSVICGTISRYDDDYDLTHLAFSGGELLVPGRIGETGDKRRLRIRASDISLCRHRPESTTMLNILPAIIEDIQPSSGPMLLLRLKLGSDRMIARITRRSCDKLALQRGDELLAQIKAVAIRN